jgi:hypothetical protein
MVDGRPFSLMAFHVAGDHVVGIDGYTAARLADLPLQEWLER